jgi:hypothetical protein
MCPNVDRDDVLKLSNVPQKMVYSLGHELNIDTDSRLVNAVLAAESLDASTPVRAFALDSPSCVSHEMVDSASWDREHEIHGSVTRHFRVGPRFDARALPCLLSSEVRWAAGESIKLIHVVTVGGCRAKLTNT